MSSDVLIEAHNVSKSYLIYPKSIDRLKQMIWRKSQFFTEYRAVQDVSFSIKRGESVGILGRNGAGKSTLLQMICGTLTPTSGSILARGRIAALLELGAGFNPEFTGRENVALAGTILGLTTQEIAARFDDILEFASIGDFIDQPVKVYSSGMYARLAFAIAAHVDADILIVDEILAVGDAAFTQKCMRYIRAFKERGTLLLVSHDTGSVRSLCDRALWMHGGTLRAEGDAALVSDAYATSIGIEGDHGATLKFGGRKAAVPETPLARDHRAAVLQASTLRNEVEVFAFNDGSEWYGEREASLIDIRLLDDDGEGESLLVGNEMVRLEVRAAAHAELDSPIIGFMVRDRLGQNLFGDNTFITYRNSPLRAPAGSTVRALFRFRMPYLPTGDYSISAAIATGTQDSHRQQHWLHDACFFKVHSSHVAKGLVGIPFDSIELSVDPAAAISLARP